MYVIGTAGHVDHGKSTLVKALTDIDPDRLPEEKEREMTVDLGFAWMTLPSGREVSIVDVPGHDTATGRVALGGAGAADGALAGAIAENAFQQQLAAVKRDFYYQTRRRVGYLCSYGATSAGKAANSRVSRKWKGSRYDEPRNNTGDPR